MIRTYKEADLETLLEIWHEASGLAHPFLSKAFVEQEDQNIRNIYIVHAKSWVFVSEEAVIGFISMIDNEIGGLFVRPDQHSKGVGSALVDYVLDMHDHLEVEVFKNNVIGRSFYDKYGFKLLSEYLHEPSQQLTCRMRYLKG